MTTREPGGTGHGREVGSAGSLTAGSAVRREVLGDAYVDAHLAGADPAARELEEYVTSMAWGVWARGGALSNRDRSLLVIAMTAAQGRREELELHVSSSARAGVTDAELDELPFQVAAYCGAPAGMSVRRAIITARHGTARQGWVGSGER